MKRERASWRMRLRCSLSLSKVFSHHFNTYKPVPELVEGVEGRRKGTDHVGDNGYIGKCKEFPRLKAILNSARGKAAKKGHPRQKILGDPHLRANKEGYHYSGIGQNNEVPNFSHFSSL